MKHRKRYNLILIILFIIFIILKFSKSYKSTFDDIIIFSLWDNNQTRNEYEISLQNSIEIDVFTTIQNSINNKIAPGTKGKFIIKFKRPQNSNYKLQIKEKTQKPQNLNFIVGQHKYSSMKDMEKIINEMFIYQEEIFINWEWKYYVNDAQDIQDTKDGETVVNYIFQIEAIVE